MSDPIFIAMQAHSNLRYNLARLSEAQFIQDARFQLLSVAAVDGDLAHVWCGNDAEWLDVFRRWNAKKRRFVGHDIRFALRVLTLRYDFMPRYVGDTALMARYLGVVDWSLDKLARQRLKKKTRKDPAYGKRLGSFTPRLWRLHAETTGQLAKLCRDLWHSLLPGFPGQELDFIQHTLALQCRKQRIDRRIAGDLVGCGEADMRKAAEMHPIIPAQVDKPHILLDHIKVSYGIELKSLDRKKLVELGDLPPEAIDFVRSVWRYRDGRKLKQDIEHLLARMSVDKKSVLCDLNYCGARSHRWSSGSVGTSPSFNMQSIDQRLAVGWVLVPRRGNIFLIGDMAQIEARITAWLADEESLVDAFANGQDVYLDFAARLFGRSLTKADSIERAVGKVAVLGLGFGMGAARFEEQLRQCAPESLSLLRKNLDINDSIEAARAVVNEYRRTYNKINDMTGAMYNTFVYLAANPDDDDMPVGTHIKKQRRGESILVKLPTGGCITYGGVGVKQEESHFGERQVPTCQGRTITFSMPVENAVQSIARDIFAKKLLRIERAGMDIAFHVHDEVIIEVPIRRAKARIGELRTILEGPDSSCPGLPLGCEILAVRRYDKRGREAKAFTAKLVNGGRTRAK